MHIDKEGLRLKLMFWFCFVGMASWAPFAGIYYKNILVNPDGTPALHLIGLAFAISPFLGIFANSFMGILADKFKIKKHLLFICAFASAACVALIGLPSLPLAADWSLLQKAFVINLGLFLFSFTLAPIIPLMNAETLDFLHRKRYDPKDFGKYRLWGSLSWIFTSALIGFLLLKSLWIGLIFFAAACGYLLLGFSASTGNKGEIKTIKIPWKKLKGDRPFLHFLIFSFIMGLGSLSSFDLTSYYMDDLNLSLLVIGLAFAVAAIFEIPFMFKASSIINRLGCKKMILWGTIVLFLKSALLVLVVPSQITLLVILVMSIHGIGFALQFNGIIEFINRRAHKDMRAIYMSINAVFGFGLAKTVGGPFSAWLISVLGSRMMMAVNSGIILLSILYFIVFILRQEESPAS